MRTLPLSKELISTETTLGLSVHSLRIQKMRCFIIGAQGRELIQCVIEASTEAYLLAKTLTQHSTIVITGKLVESSQSKTGGLEIHVTTLKLESLASLLPITETSAMGLRHEHRVAELKFPYMLERLQLMSKIEHIMRTHLIEKGFTQIRSPKIMGGVSETGSEVFKLSYFGQEACLAQSPQFYKQIAICSGLQKVFEFGPVFRAEESYGPRHLTEFQGFDVEVAWVCSVHELIEVETEVIKAIFKGLERTVPEFITLSLEEIHGMFKEAGISYTAFEPLTHEQEKAVYRLTGKEFIFVTGYPISCRPFYHRFHEKEGTTESFELLYKGLEITTGAIREHRVEVLNKQAAEKGLTLEGIKHYLSAFEYGAPPHGGFGLGMERLVMQLLQLESVREVCFIPRSVERLFP